MLFLILGPNVAAIAGGVGGAAGLLIIVVGTVVVIGVLVKFKVIPCGKK